MASDGIVSRWNGVEYLAEDERCLDSVLMLPGASAFGSRGGRRINGGLVVSVGGAPESWSVTAGAGVVDDVDYETHGPWKFVIPATVTDTMGARPGSGQSRIDLIVAQITDSDSSIGATKEIHVVRVPGTAGTSPVAPDVPPLSLVLATLTVPASGSISVTQSSQLVVAAGGVLPVATTAERDALVTDGIAYVGMKVYNAQTSREQTWNGTIWVSTPISYSGVVSITPDTANTPKGVAVTFPAGLFPATPAITVTPNSGSVGTTVIGWGYTGASASGATIYATKTNTTAVSMAYTAILGQ